MDAVYPRWRGEHEVTLNKGLTFTGLSPLAWGTQPLGWAVRCVSRFIPAGVGNTIENLQQSGLKPVYPRWRGEHTTQFFPQILQSGLSPLAWGTPLHQDGVVTVDRFIPAGVGNTTMRSVAGVSIPVYPRWRGEHFADRVVSIFAAGLSPLAWGTPAEKRQDVDWTRFIPAGVGNTKSP